MSRENILEAFRKFIVPQVFQDEANALPENFSEDSVEKNLAFFMIVKGVEPFFGSVESFFVQYSHALFERRKIGFWHVLTFFFYKFFKVNFQQELHKELAASSTEFCLSHLPRARLEVLSAPQIPSALMEVRDELCAKFLTELSQDGQLSLRKLFALQRGLLFKKLFAQHAVLLFLYVTAIAVFATGALMLFSGEGERIIDAGLGWIDFLRNLFGIGM